MLKYLSICAALVFATLAQTASAATFLRDGSVLDFGGLRVGATASEQIEFNVGDTGGDPPTDENLFFIEAITEGQLPFSFRNIDCSPIGLGVDCTGFAQFNPTSSGSFSADYLFTADTTFFVFDPTLDGDVFAQQITSIRVTLVGTADLAPVPLPASAVGLLIGLLALALKRKSVRRSMMAASL